MHLAEILPMPETKKERRIGKHTGRVTPTRRVGIILGAVLLVSGLYIAARMWIPRGAIGPVGSPAAVVDATEHGEPLLRWVARTRCIDSLFHQVYTAGWEGANGAIGDAHLYAVTRDSMILRFHMIDHPLMDLYNGSWVDDRAWVCLAEMYWWRFTGRSNDKLVRNARARYDEARMQGRLSRHEGYWSWYNWPPGSGVNDRIFTNSNMNQMVTVACWLYEATRDERYRRDALLVWNGDGATPGIERTLYHGNGIWKGARGPAAFGKQLPWEGSEYCSIGAAMYRMTGEKKYLDIVVATAKRMLDPRTGWVDPTAFYQLRMDGNGAFVHYLLDAYMLAPKELPDVPAKIEKMLDHVWTNAHGTARVTLHRRSDHGIRNGWNPNGGEDGYGVDEVGTVHAQSQAVRAFGVWTYALKTVVLRR
jgi:hypothetical protein